MWSGFSTEDIKQFQLAEVNSEENVMIENSEDADQKEQLLSRGVAKTAKINKSSIRNSKNIIARKTQSQKNESYPVPSGAKFTQLSEELNAADSCSNSSFDMAISRSSNSSLSQNPNDDTSPSKNSSGSQGKSVTILVGDDKSYKVISTTGEEDPAKLKDDLNGEVDDRLPHHQKAFLVEANGSVKGQDKTTLEQFQERQKLMEEQNKRKKELLTKAIADRKRRTRSEAQKLVQIQEELSRLDALLSTDVGILRNQIELASYEFNEAQKRYDRAESEFIDAKIQLFNKLERKELLTEHLCRIIEVNEQRKAKKLSELMAKLEISEDKANVICTDIEAHVFPLTASLNEVTYTTCSTLKHPNKTPTTANEVHTVATFPDETLSPPPQAKEPSNNTPETNESVRKQCSRGNEALETINLITAHSLDHRNEDKPCDLNVSQESTGT